MPSIRTASDYSSACSSHSSVRSSVRTSDRHRHRHGHGSAIDAAAFSSQSTAPTSVGGGSPRIPVLKPVVAYAGSPPTYADALVAHPKKRTAFQPSQKAHDLDLSPATLCYPRASVDTYVDYTDSDSDSDSNDGHGHGHGHEHEHEHAVDDLADTSDDESWLDGSASLPRSRPDGTIAPLPDYCPDICGGVNSMPYTATPDEFARLFPSLNRMSIRHDETTADGNMNLRVDIVVPVGERRRLTSYQLFHLRMYDLAKRDFSLRRYGRDSGREVCNAKLTFADPADKKHPPTADLRPSLPRSVTSALRSLAAAKPMFRRGSTSSQRSQRSQPGHDSSRPSTAHGTPCLRGCLGSSSSSSPPSSPAASPAGSTPSLDVKHPKTKTKPKPKPKPQPTNSIKLEFSNYARVDVVRAGSGSASNDARYEFSWWGHAYAWRRSHDKLLGTVSYHLLRDDGRGGPVAHIVPETRAPNERDAEARAGGWVPPCHLYLADPSVLDAATDVADVIVATGLVALADDCIRTHWPARPRNTADTELAGPRALLNHVFHRRGSLSSTSSTPNGTGAYMSSPLRHKPVY